MEENLSIIDELHQQLTEPKTDIRTYSPLTFAYIGDAVYEIVIRTMIVEKGQQAVNALHKQTTKLVCAASQAAMAEAIIEGMTQEEQDIYRRGKNSKINSSAKNMSLEDYRKATGFEAVCGYLYLTGKTARIVELVKCGINKLKLTV